MVPGLVPGSERLRDCIEPPTGRPTAGRAATRLSAAPARLSRTAALLRAILLRLRPLLRPARLLRLAPSPLVTPGRPRLAGGNRGAQSFVVSIWKECSTRWKIGASTTPVAMTIISPDTIA